MYPNTIHGKTVTVTVDRPLGTHHPKHLDIFYNVNYGYVEGIFAGDGEEQDAYILGVDVPVEQFTGQVIAVARRRDDVEDKWIVAPEGISFTKEQSLNSIWLQEQYFDTEILMQPNVAR